QKTLQAPNCALSDATSRAPQARGDGPSWPRTRRNVCSSAAIGRQPDINAPDPSALNLSASVDRMEQSDIRGCAAVFVVRDILGTSELVCPRSKPLICMRPTTTAAAPAPIR